MLVTLKVCEHVWSLRARRAFDRLVPIFAVASERLGMRLAHFSVQSDHIHLIVELEHGRTLGRAVGGLCVRIARALNRMMKRSGKVFADRYHHRVLGTPRQVRHALAYVLCNGRKHGHAPRAAGWLDPCSSARAFRGWRGALTEPCVDPPASPTAAARTWLLSVGWRRAGGELDPDHTPGSMPASTPRGTRGTID